MTINMVKNVSVIPYANEKIRCNSCKLGRGYFCYILAGGNYDYVTCPFCGDYDSRFYDYYEDKHDEDPNDERATHCFHCHSCNMIFMLGCIHSLIGCSSNIHNGHVVSKWIDLNTDDIHHGMPQFDSLNEWKTIGPTVRILEWSCPNSQMNISTCSKSRYSPDDNKGNFGCNL
jgi:hypothetical protein